MLLNDVRRTFAKKHREKEYRNGTIELQGVSFLCDGPSLFGNVNESYVKAEIDWYESQDTNVTKLFELYGKHVKIWGDTADYNGFVNSQYGHLIYSEENGEQFNNVYNELNNFPDSRRAVMIYTRPTMHYEAHANGMNDFTCTNAVQYFINGKWLDVVVQMRSNDAVFGFNNDYAWQRHVQTKLRDALGTHLELGPIRWQVGSLHLYERHYPLLEKWMEDHGY